MLAQLFVLYPLEAYRVAGEVPFYLEDWFGALVLVAWGAIPVVLGYWRFERSDLG